MQLVVLDVNTSFIKKAKDVFKECRTDIQFHTGNVRDYPIDNTAFISPANSLGFMDGGIDAAYMMMFEGVQKSVRDKIRRLGLQTGLGRPYLPIGSALYVPVGDRTILISAPTMFLPHNVAATMNAYHAFMAALCMYEKAKRECPWLNVLVCPALCTGYGCMPAKEAAAQMKQALDDFLTGKKPNETMFSEKPDCYITSLHDHEQPKIFDNREIQDDAI